MTPQEEEIFWQIMEKLGDSLAMIAADCKETRTCLALIHEMLDRINEKLDRVELLRESSGPERRAVPPVPPEQAGEVCDAGLGARIDDKELLCDPGAHDLNADFAPKYIRLGRILRVRIQRGEFPGGSLLDRKAIAAEYGVCPNTVSGALSALSYNGYAEAVNGPHFGYRWRVVYPRKNRPVS